MYRSYRNRTGWLTLLLLATMPFAATSEPRTWNTATGSWHEAGNWTPAGVPGPGDGVSITNTGAYVLLTNSTAIQSLTLNKALLFSGWSTVLTGDQVTVQNGGTIGLPAAFTNLTAVHRVSIVCSNLTVASGGSINVNARGFAGGTSTHPAGYGPGGAGGNTAGGGHGGAGSGWTLAGTENDTVDAPTNAGSGGGRSVGTGGAGGGVVDIQATGTVTVYGSITANGANGTNDDGGGAGGTISIRCLQLDGNVTGLLQANGGAGQDVGGGGGGGRIALIYTGNQGQPGVRFQTSGGAKGSRSLKGVDGTVYLTDTAMLSPVLGGNLFTDVRLYLGVPSWTVDSLTVTNCGVTFASAGLHVTITNDVHVTTGGKLGIGDPGSTAVVWTCGRHFTLTNNGSLSVYGGRTNLISDDYGVLVHVGKILSVHAGSWIYSVAHPTDGGAPLFRAANLYIHPGGGIDATGRGYGRQTGPGKGVQSGNSSGGGGYGGAGGAGLTGGAGGSTYGSSNAPIRPGSGGGYIYTGAMGGGAVRIEANNEVRVDGLISANGGSIPPVGENYVGGGSGGAIYIDCALFSGAATGQLNANGSYGGPGRGGDGGGGRIAVWRQGHTYQGTVSATNATAGGGFDGLPGTIVWEQTPFPGTLFMIQ